MSQAHALSDDQVSQELKKMTAFIKQEAMEKAREIEIKADEEFAIEKSKLVRTETSTIDSTYEKKFKSAKMSQTITASTLANKTRLKVLSARQELLDGIFESAEGKLQDVSRDEKGYEGVLKALMLEGMYALNEKGVKVRGREKDKGVLGRAKGEAEKEYKRETGRECKVDVDGEVLPEGDAGGLTIIGGNGKIDINNTFEERLRLLKENALPAVRQTLFGKNENRKFYD